MTLYPLQCEKGGLNDHITSRCPHNALFRRVVLESKIISCLERRKEAHLARYRCFITLVREKSRCNTRKEQQRLSLAIHRERYHCASQIEEIILMTRSKGRI